MDPDQVMTFDKIEAIFDKCGISLDPAISRKELLLRIDELPPEYRDVALGLYYPDEKRIWIPPVADEQTVKHEVGHAWCDYYYNDIGEPCAEAFRRRVNNMSNVALRCKPSRLPVRRAPVKQSGTYTSIISVEAPSSAAPGSMVEVSVAVENIYSQTIHILVVAIRDKWERFIDQDAWISPGAENRFAISGSFQMPDADVASIRIMVFYDAGTEQDLVPVWVQDGDDYLVTVSNPSSQVYVIPPEYTLQSNILYPAIATYDGYAEMCTFGFTAPLTIVPGISWAIDKMLGEFPRVCSLRGATPLELRIWTTPAQLGSTHYIVQAMAYPNTVQRKAVPLVPIILVPAAPAGAIAWGGIILAIVIVIGIAAAGFSIVSVINASKVKTTTTQNPYDETVPANQSFTNVSGTGLTGDAGSKGATVSDKSGNTTKIPAGQSFVIPAGGNAVDSGGGNTVIHIPGGTTTIEKPGEVPVITDTVKYIVIGALGIVGVVGLIAAFQAFGKRKLYHVRA